MKIEYKDFVGIYDNSIPIKICEEFVENYETSEQNVELGDFSIPELSGADRLDSYEFVTPVISTILPRPPVEQYFIYLKSCFGDYVRKYSIEFGGAFMNDTFKIHKVKKSEGYHRWHYENASATSMDRLMVYMTYLEAPKEGGETEFLHQSLRIKPVVGRTLIWPAGYTHMHRGNPPLDGEKMYITGWFKGARTDFATTM